MKTIRETFQVGSFHYLIEFGDTGNIVFELTNPPIANKAREKYAFPAVVSGTDDVGVLGNSAILVFRQIEQRTLNWIYTQRPYMLHFYPSTTAKIGLYRRLATKLSKKLGSHYSMVEDNDAYHYFRFNIQNGLVSSVK
jgi:hypothetical protein